MTDKDIEILNQDFEGTELCPYCDNETDFVFNPAKDKHIICKHCGKEIKPCSLCNGSTVDCCEEKCLSNIRSVLLEWNS